jgi:hypothetical protein
MTTELIRFTQWARESPQRQYNALMGMLTDPAGLNASFERQASSKAPGVDGMRKADYAEGLQDRLADLAARVRRLGYRPKPVRRVYIPKASGGRRALGVPQSSSSNARRMSNSTDPQSDQQAREGPLGTTLHRAMADRPCGVAGRAGRAQFRERDHRVCRSRPPDHRTGQIRPRRGRSLCKARCIQSHRRYPTEEPGLLQRRESGRPQHSIASRTRLLRSGKGP